MIWHYVRLFDVEETSARFVWVRCRGNAINVIPQRMLPMTFCHQKPGMFISWHVILLAIPTVTWDYNT